MQCSKTQASTTETFETQAEVGTVAPGGAMETGAVATGALDEFAVPAEARAAVMEQRPRIERLFGVGLNVLGVLGAGQGPSRAPGGAGQIWLQLQGPQHDLQRAKEYIKGLCSPELSQEVCYPKDMQCVFVGAQGLFLDCLTKGTSANLVLLSPGSLLVSGLAEAFVMAQSRIQEFVEKYQKTPRLPEEQEALVKKAFRELVESHDDKHAIDLLILPTPLKEELLSLVRDIQQEVGEWEPRNVLWVPPAISQDQPPWWEAKATGGARSQGWPQDFFDLSRPPDQTRHQDSRSGNPGISQDQAKLGEEASERPVLYKRSSKPIPGLDASQQAQDLMFPATQDRVREEEERGPEESSQEEEEELSAGALSSSWTEKEFKMRLNFFKTMGYEEQVVKKVLLECGVQEAPSKILDRVQTEQASFSQQEHGPAPFQESGASRMSSPPPPPPPPETTQDEHEYLLEVIKSAAANCGHSPSEIPAEIWTGVPLAGLLRRLNEKASHQQEARVKTRLEHRGSCRDGELALSNGKESPQGQHHCEPGRKGGSPIHRGVRGPPPLPEGSDFPMDVTSVASPAWASEESQPAEDVYPVPVGPVPTVTGAQRFKEAIQTPFKLILANTPGKKNLRRVIIDGSNVAMVHGLHQFFSCRGIALAVQYFWDRGHREVTVFVPQWRMEKVARVEEKHFLTQLQDLSLLSLTPSRQVAGKRITSYDDRFMLRLAEETNGVIVTNDQLRDLMQESKKWIRIIKERLLQFTFVGNIFMVPDDPLGREGPTLDEFLQKPLSRPKPPTCHSFAGRGGPFPAPSRPASQTEVLQLRDRKPPGDRRRRRQPQEEKGEEEEVVRKPWETERLRQELLTIFMGQDQKVDFVLHREPCSRDLNKLSENLLSLNF
ncbi:protein KHNYN isoform X3 [Mauremys reevesii]|uniref:protein KHNYN isoform X3 n=1 Tax=Mauremys reevesii TaxID=260615 RepID=UPI00193F1F64|nr:protein KHNYN isoform X3 [Mauremys reevesii]